MHGILPQKQCTRFPSSRVQFTLFLSFSNSFFPSRRFFFFFFLLLFRSIVSRPVLVPSNTHYPKQFARTDRIYNCESNWCGAFCNYCESFLVSYIYRDPRARKATLASKYFRTIYHKELCLCVIVSRIYFFYRVLYLYLTLHYITLHYNERKGCVYWRVVSSLFCSTGVEQRVNGV